MGVLLAVIAVLAVVAPAGIVRMRVTLVLRAVVMMVESLTCSSRDGGYTLRRQRESQQQDS